MDKIFPINVPHNVFPPALDKYLSMPTIFTFIVIFQGCFGGLGIIQTPKFLSDLMTEHKLSPLWRFMFVAAIAYTATSDIETATLVTLVFFAFLHTIRTKEEKEEVPFLI